jgi:hypothetical protein
MMTGFEASKARTGQSAGSDQPNLAVEQTAGSHSLAAAGQRERSTAGWVTRPRRR